MVVPKVVIKKQLTKNIDASATRTLEQNPKNNVKVKYKFNNNIAVIGQWDGGQEDKEQSDTSDTSNEVIGLDLEYKIKFK